MAIRFKLNGEIDGRSFNGSKRTVSKETPCKECKGILLAGRNVKFCCNACRLKNLHDSVRQRGDFFGEVCWKLEEDEILRKMYPNPDVTIHQIVDSLPGRTVRAVEHRLYALKIGREYQPGQKRKVEWSEERKKWLSERMSGVNNPFYGKTLPEETRKRISETLKTTSAFHWLNKDPEFQKKRRAAWHGAVKASPNKAETFLDGVIQEACPGMFKFVGDGSFIIDGMNPDWVCEKDKLVIELFGKSFHHSKHCRWKIAERATAKGRRKALAVESYDMLLFWDDEIKKKPREDLIEKVRGFFGPSWKNISPLVS